MDAEHQSLLRSGQGLRNMRIEIGTPAPSEEGWLTVEHIASVHVTSHKAQQPIESIFKDDAVKLVRPGAWDATHHAYLYWMRRGRIRSVQLQFSEPRRERTQEFVLQWASTLEGERKVLLASAVEFQPSRFNFRNRGHPAGPRRRAHTLSL